MNPQPRNRTMTAGQRQRHDPSSRGDAPVCPARDLARERLAGAAPRYAGSTLPRVHEQPAGTLNEETWGFSSAGRASALQAEGQGFESPKLHLRIHRRGPSVTGC